MTVPGDLRPHLQPVLDRHSDLILRGRFLYMTPVTWFLRFVHFDGQLRSDYVLVRTGVVPTFGYPHIWTGNGYRVHAGLSTDRPTFCHWSRPDAVAKVFATIETIDLPALRTLRTFAHFLGLFDHGTPFRPTSIGKPHDLFKMEAAIGKAMMGDIVGARLVAREVTANVEHYRVKHPEIVEDPGVKWEARCVELINGGRSGALAEYLHASCAAFCEWNELSAHYERVPFPVEAEPWFPGPPPGFLPGP